MAVSPAPAAGLRMPEPDRLWPPADVVKRGHLLQIFQARGHRVLIESGTYLGGTVDHFLDHAERIVSVELDDALHAAAARRFAGCPNVEIVHGDSGVLIPRLAAAATTPPLLWLDGHFSGAGTAHGPETEPAATILDALARVGLPQGTSILVDDLRLFGVDPEFPSLETLVAAARAGFPHALVYAELDALVVLA